MESEADLKPELSVIVPALRGYETVLAALDAWEAQTCRDQLEILVLCPSAPDSTHVAAGQTILSIGSSQLHEARSLGIRRASGEFIVLAEDHCLPDPRWAEAMLSCLAQGWDGVGPALRSGNPINGWTQASFLLGYGEWINPQTGSAAVLPGHNVVIRKSLLLQLGSQLEQDMLVSAFLLRRLHRHGHRFYLESRATMRHFDIAVWNRSLRILFYVGIGFGAVRVRRWPRAARVLYVLATPAVAARHWLRALLQYRRTGAKAGLTASCLAVAAALSVAWACGEAFGAIIGTARAAPFVTLGEIKPVGRDEV
ncbi:MAG TPA: glycosyltransferase family 2 protein [Bryobacteraceae bacterium]|nr:glycosyltransferase family 2 protein [Bryobacteraceae bacterium]